MDPKYKLKILQISIQESLQSYLWIWEKHSTSEGSPIKNHELELHINWNITFCPELKLGLAS